MATAFLERWLEEVVAAPGATGIHDLGEARRVLLDDALRAVPIVDGCSGPVIDVGSGGAVAHAQYREDIERPSRFGVVGVDPQRLLNPGGIIEFSSDHRHQRAVGQHPGVGATGHFAQA